MVTESPIAASRSNATAHAVIAMPAAAAIRGESVQWRAGAFEVPGAFSAAATVGAASGLSRRGHLERFQRGREVRLRRQGTEPLGTRRAVLAGVPIRVAQRHARRQITRLHLQRRLE